MSAARNLSKMINKENYITHSGHSSVSGLDMPTETSMVGMITSFSMTTASDWRATNRWLICDGSAISRTTYSDLFLVVGTTWGVGDGSSTFNLPDLRGTFLRGTGTGVINGVNKAGGNVGQFQVDEMTRHTGKWDVASINNYGNVKIYEGVSTPSVAGTQPAIIPGNSGAGQTMSYTSGGSHGYSRMTIDIGDGDETRPYNASVQFCIKY